MVIACTEEMYQQATTWLENGLDADYPQGYSNLMTDADGVIDSLLLTFHDTYGTVQKRRPTHLYTKYETKVWDGDPPLGNLTYGHALTALDDMDLIEHDTNTAKNRWLLTDTDPRWLMAVKEAARDPIIQQLYD